MADSLNIKNAATYRLIRELADVTGETMTEAVTIAVRERLARTQREHDATARSKIERMTAVATEMRRLAPEGYWEQDVDAELYDDDGLPR